MQTRPLRRRRDRGFSLLIVFMLMIVMVGAAATVILSTQQDLSVAGQDREALQAFYAAEYGVAAAKDFISANTLTFWNSGTGWTPLFATTDPALQNLLCQPSATPTTTPGTMPKTTDPWTDFKGTTAAGGPGHFYVAGGASGPYVQYRWCVHNDANDIAYVDPSVLVVGETANTSDAHDNPGHYMVIEAFGQVTTGSGSPLASSHIWVTVGTPQGTPVVPQNCYSQEGGCGSHEDSTGSAEKNVGVIATSGSPTVRGL